jgi:hypothetical protein
MSDFLAIHCVCCVACGSGRRRGVSVALVYVALCSVQVSFTQTSKAVSMKVKSGIEGGEFLQNYLLVPYLRRNVRHAWFTPSPNQKPACGYVDILHYRTLKKTESRTYRNIQTIGIDVYPLDVILGYIQDVSRYSGREKPLPSQGIKHIILSFSP